jgi:hypothetical protein
MPISTLRDKLENARFRRMMAQIEGRTVAVLFWDCVLSDLSEQLEQVA